MAFQDERKKISLQSMGEWLELVWWAVQEWWNWNDDGMMEHGLGWWA